jgi:hypothetical protein
MPDNDLVPFGTRAEIAAALMYDTSYPQLVSALPAFFCEPSPSPCHSLNHIRQDCRKKTEAILYPTQVVETAIERAQRVFLRGSYFNEVSR